MPKLIVKQGGTSREMALTKDTISIGRTPENDIELKDSLISRKHTSIVRKGDKYVVYDLGSSNGTFVNRERIEMKPLDDGDIIRVGDSEIHYVEDGPARGLPKPVTDRRPTEIPAPPGQGQVVKHVDEIAESFSFDITGALSKGLSLRDIRGEAVGEKAAKESKMFFILFQVGKALSTAEKLDDMLLTAVKLIFEVVNAERSVLLLKDPHTGELSTRMAYHRMRGIVDELRQNGPRAEEFERARAYAAGRRVLAFENTNAVARYAANQTIVFGEDIDPDQAIAALDETTLDRVAEVAAGISVEASVACVGPHEVAEFA